MVASGRTPEKPTLSAEKGGMGVVPRQIHLRNPCEPQDKRGARHWKGSRDMHRYVVQFSQFATTISVRLVGQVDTIFRSAMFQLPLETALPRYIKSIAFIDTTLAWAYVPLEADISALRWQAKPLQLTFTVCIPGQSDAFHYCPICL